MRARVVAMHRQRAQLLGDDIDTAVPLSGNAAAMRLTVGDWVLVDMQKAWKVVYPHETTE